MAHNKDKTRLMFLNSEDVEYSNKEPSESSPIWSKDAEVLERYRRFWVKVSHQGRNNVKT